jgi:hypothetical protein
VAHNYGESFLLFLYQCGLTQQEQELKAANRKESEYREGNPKIAVSFFEPFCPRLASKFAKSADMINEKNFLFRNGY